MSRIWGGNVVFFFFAMVKFLSIFCMGTVGCRPQMESKYQNGIEWKL